MTPLQLLGTFLLAAPFMGLAAYSARLLGWKDAALTWAALILFFLLIAAGVLLTFGPATKGC